MADSLSRTSSTEKLLPNESDEFEMEKKQQYSRESPNDDDSDDTCVPIMGNSQRTKQRYGFSCTGERAIHLIVVIILLYVAVLSLVVIALCIYVGVNTHRNETQCTCSSAGTSSELEDHGERLFHLSAKLENVEDRISIFESTLIQLNSSLSNLSSSVPFLIDADEAASNNISDLQRSLGLIEDDFETQLQNLSSMYTNLQSDNDAIILDIYTTRATMQQNASQLHDLIHQVEKNHSSILVKLSRDLNEAAMNRSMLAQRIEDTSNLVGSQGQIIDGIRSNVTALCGKLTTNVKNLNTHIHDQAKRINKVAQDISTLAQKIDDTSNLVASQRQTIDGLGSNVTAVQDSVTGLRETLTRNVKNLNTHINDHVKWINEAARDKSTLAQKIDDTSNLVRSQGQIIGGIRTNVTSVQNSVTRLRGTLTTDVNNLDNRIDDHVDKVQHNLDELSKMLTNFNSRMGDIEWKLALPSDAICIMPLGFLLLGAITLLSVCYVTL
jgi:chromosome segregation ATPase